MSKIDEAFFCILFYLCVFVYKTRWFLIGMGVAWLVF
ncbi:hypothetical protein KVP40.0202 [Vibrio phage KVP40]|uniref:Uncharacterized protein n=1 Tax=Vibrio phage KVP40 (isolate Vibrio parahaemolyticus/Japan/Matsuzaki/1991) TaxID=75320 RepID=Q6WHV2_BPKVM|nr:hypothetical protein KVP40.0202 [Vibrio phage KVP40]AAQ64271.1 hypothetical protein KVP40.0202 [Vibrio phage KVP40]